MARYPESRGKLTRAVAAGKLVRLCPGILTAATLADNPLVRAHAAHLWCPRHVLMGASAARVTFWPDCPGEIIDLAGEKAGSNPEIVRLHRLKVPPELRANWGTAAITCPELTVLDMATMGNWKGLCEALRTRTVTLGSLTLANELLAGRNGSTTRRECLTRAAGNPWSVPEMDLQVLYRQHKITGWVGNRKITCAGRTVIPDIAFDALKLVVEVDGRKYHSKLEDFERDRQRANWFIADGWRVLQFTPQTIWHDPREVIELTQAALAAAAHQIGQ